MWLPQKLAFFFALVVDDICRDKCLLDRKKLLINGEIHCLFCCSHSNVMHMKAPQVGKIHSHLRKWRCLRSIWMQQNEKVLLMFCICQDECMQIANTHNVHNRFSFTRLATGLRSHQCQNNSNYIKQGCVLEYSCFGLHDSDLGFGCFGDSQNITDGAFSWSSGPGHIADRLHSAKYTAVPLIHHPCTGSTVIFTSPIYENTPLPMCSPLSNASCSISLTLLKVQPGFSRCLWFCCPPPPPPLLSSSPQGFTVYNSLDWSGKCAVEVYSISFSPLASFSEVSVQSDNNHFSPRLMRDVDNNSCVIWALSWGFL